MRSAVEHFRDPRVAVWRGPGEYPLTAPFNPSVRYPEYEPRLDTTQEANPAYEAVREALSLLGLDRRRFGSSEWDPLGEVIRPGETVVIKPNFVLSDHYRGGNLYSIITHPSIIRAVLDYTYKALRGEGRIIIADTPQMDCDFHQLLDRTGLPAVQALYQARLGFPLPIRDLRAFWFKYKDENYVASQEKRISLPGDPEGSIVVDLDGRSAFSSAPSSGFYGADYDRLRTVAHHSGGRHEYKLSRTVLESDVLISIPKLKVHKKVGVTLNAKGFVGTVTDKNCLVHYTLGGPAQGGDQFPPWFLRGARGLIVRTQRHLYDRLLSRRDRLGNRLYRSIYTPYRILLKPLLKRTTETINLYDGGNWHGNDSAWRMVSDLVKLQFYADAQGTIHEVPQRRIFSIVDGIVGGEGNGPLFPDERRVGVVIAGFNPIAVDIVGTRLMGFDWMKLKWIRDLLQNEHFDFFVSDKRIDVLSTGSQYQDLLTSPDRHLSFVPHPGWVGELEYGPEVRI